MIDWKEIAASTDATSMLPATRSVARLQKLGWNSCCVAVKHDVLDGSVRGFCRAFKVVGAFSCAAGAGSVMIADLDRAIFKGWPYGTFKIVDCWLNFWPGKALLYVVGKDIPARCRLATLDVTHKFPPAGDGKQKMQAVLRECEPPFPDLVEEAFLAFNRRFEQYLT